VQAQRATPPTWPILQAWNCYEQAFTNIAELNDARKRGAVQRPSRQILKPDPFLAGTAYCQHPHVIAHDCEQGSVDASATGTMQILPQLEWKLRVLFRERVRPRIDPSAHKARRKSTYHFSAVSGAKRAMYLRASLRSR
jgi:hypothetical protein